MASIETPCIRICVVHPTARLCAGCGRSLDEITRWVILTDEERGRIMAQLPPRLAAMSRANSSPDTASAHAAPLNAATPNAAPPNAAPPDAIPVVA
jgi:hypothetical protein